MNLMIWLRVFLLAFCLLVEVKCYRSTVEFNLPKAFGNAYVGQLYKHEMVVRLNPQLKALSFTETKEPNKICGFNVISKDGRDFPFEVVLLDSIAGTGEIRVRNDIPMDFSQNRIYTFQIAARDCESPPNYSERVFVNVNILAKEELRFTEPSYTFSTVAYSRVGEICGKVTVIHESSIQPLGTAENCGYSLPVSDIVPFTVDSHGVIRVRDVLTSQSPRFYKFRVQYKDCGILRPEIVATTVNVQVIQKECEQRWKGLPSSVEYSTVENLPKRLLWPPTYQLEMCGLTCTEHPRILSKLALLHGRPDLSLNTARPSYCRHDLRSLGEQRRLCDVDEATLVDLLPDPNRDLYLQHISPAIGAFPEVVPLTYALRFSAAEKSGWRLDTARLVKAAREAAEARRLESPIQSNANLYSQQQEAFSSITPQNLFERDFTLSFWLQRQPTDNDDHETILCSQEDSVTMGHALWISLKDCRIMVQMTTHNPQTNHPETYKSFRTYFFPRLPSNLCSTSGQQQEQQLDWHHYSISVAVDQETADLSMSSLLVDGELVGNLEAHGSPISLKRSTAEVFPQYVTVGTCYDPSIPGAQQSLNGAIAGMTLLMGNNEDQSVSRCLAECGESLLIPRASGLITDDVNVLLNTDNILIETVTSAEAAELLSNIAYVKPGSTSTQLTFEPAGSNLRVLELTTVFRCGDRRLGNITTARINLNLQNGLGLEMIPMPDSASNKSPHSSWVPQTEVDISPPAQPISPLVSPTRQYSEVGSLHLAVAGQETITATIPVRQPGVPMFPGLTFTFSNVPSKLSAVARSAATFVLDQCLVLPVNGGDLDFDSGERISWSAGRAFDLGINVEPTKSGILLKGARLAKEYASVLHGLHYWPPFEIERTANDRALASGILLERKFQLICSYDGAGDSTDPFTVTVVMTSPLVDQPLGPGESLIFADNSVVNRPPIMPQQHQNNFVAGGIDQLADDEFDDDDDDDFYDEMLGDDPNAQLPPPLPQQPLQTQKKPEQSLNPSAQYQDAFNKPLPAGDGSAVNFAHSDKETRSGESLKLQERKDETKNETSALSPTQAVLVIGATISAMVVIVVALALIARRSKFLRRSPASLFGRRPGSGVKAARLAYRPETSLNVIENPIDVHEGGRLNWRPPTAAPNPKISMGVPGVHGSYSDRDEQFDAETRSFNGLFEEDDDEEHGGVDGGRFEDSTDAGAALEEVDDFDESEVHPAHMEPRSLGVAYEEEEEEEAASDHEDETSFSMGPNHLEFVTLPSPRRGFNADVSNI